MRVALFNTCIGDAMFPDVLKATAVILSRLGYEVVVPEEQTCCGQMHYNTGYRKEVVPMVENYVDAFSDPSIDYVVAPSGSCIHSVRSQHPQVAELYGTAALREGVSKVTKKSLDLSEFLIDVAQTDNVGAFFPHRVTYHPSCHGKRMLGLGERPLQLLRNVEAIDLVELPNAEECCGFGGTFSIKAPEVSAAMVNDKTRHIRETGAEYVTGGDQSCLWNIGGTLSRQHAGIRAVHMAEILASTKEHPWTPTSAVYDKEKML